MPILDIEIVAPDGPIESSLTAALADAAGAVLDTELGRTWVRVRELAAAQYAEDGGGPPAGVRSVFVSVLVARIPAPTLLREQVRRLIDEIATICDRPAENVHVLFLPGAAGRMAFGGRLVEAP